MTARKLKSKEDQLTESFNTLQHARFSLMGAMASWDIPDGKLTASGSEFSAEMLYIPGRSRILSLELFSPAKGSFRVEYSERGGDTPSWQTLATIVVGTKNTVVRYVKTANSDKILGFNEKDWNLRVVPVANIDNDDVDAGTMQLVVIYANL